MQDPWTRSFDSEPPRVQEHGWSFTLCFLSCHADAIIAEYRSMYPDGLRPTRPRPTSAMLNRSAELRCEPDSDVGSSPDERALLAALDGWAWVKTFASRFGIHGSGPLQRTVAHRSRLWSANVIQTAHGKSRYAVTSGLAGHWEVSCSFMHEEVQKLKHVVVSSLRVRGLRLRREP